MNTILAIAMVSIRSAIRSKVVIVLLIFLLTVLIGLPLTVRGDGTAAGHVRLLLRYTLGLAALILSLATVWASCAAISGDIRDRHIQLMLSKPVHAFQLWIGKWIGLLCMNAVLLTVCAITAYGAMRWSTQPNRLSAEQRAELHEEILIAQRRLTPRPANLQPEARRLFEAARARGEIPGDYPVREVLDLIERSLEAEANAVAPEEFTRWTYDLPRRPTEERPLVLRYRFMVSTLDLEAVEGVWTIGAPNAARRHRVEVSGAPRAWHTVQIPAEYVADDGSLTIEYANVHPRPTTVLFDAREDLRLMLYEGGFLLNYLRANLLILIHLGFLGAIGLTAGSYFSIPVAAMVSFYALLLVNVGRFVGRLAAREVSMGDTPDAGWLTRMMAEATRQIYGILDLIVGPISAQNPLDFVAVGEWIGWSDVAYMGGTKLLLYSGVLLSLGIWHLSRKEVALPS